MRLTKVAPPPPVQNVTNAAAAAAASVGCVAVFVVSEPPAKDGGTVSVGCAKFVVARGTHQRPGTPPTCPLRACPTRSGWAARL